MACQEEIHLDDVGTVFELTLLDCGVPVDISGASALTILFLKPDKSLEIKTAVLATDGLDGKIQYITVAGDLDQIKTWEIQARIVLPTGSWTSNSGKFKVYPNLDT